MTVNCVLGRVALSAVFVAVAFAVEYMVARIRARREHLRQTEMSAYQAQLDEALRILAEERAVAPGRRSAQDGAARRDYRSLTAEERQARKDWARARLMDHPKIPSWHRDAEYLELVLDAAHGGCSEAMNKLAEYAIRRCEYVEAYYWALKMELAGFKITCMQPAAILRHWLKHSADRGHRDLHMGFNAEQYLFARSVLRIRSGIEKERGLSRLRQLAESEDPDAVLYVEKFGLGSSAGNRSDGVEKLR